MGKSKIRDQSNRTINLFKTIKIIFLCLGSLYLTLTAGAQERRIIPRMTSGINFDGIPDEEIWTKVESFPLVMHAPNNGKIPEQKTDVRLFYDDMYLYMGASAYYKDPGMITRIGKTRDFISWDCDWIGISIDTYNDKQNIMLFGVNPNGTRNDGTTQNDMINGMFDINFNFNTFWDAEVKIIGNVWHSEIRIPLSTLRFQGNTDNVIMGIIILRANANSNNPDFGKITYPLIPQIKGDMLFWKASMAEEVEFGNLKSRKPAYLTPYVLGGINRFYDADASDAKTDYKFEAGADFKYGLTNNLTLDVTANTDFAQVEADQEQFNLTRFSLFFPEKRLFFQEKSDVFDFSFNLYDNLFYSRNIGLYNGNPVRIYGGLRLTGRIGEWDLGLLDMQTAKFEDLSGQNFGILRIKRTGILNQNSYLGGIITSRIGADGTYNLAYGVDSRLNLFGDDYLTVKWAQTFNDGAENKIFSINPSQIYLKWEKKRIKGFNYAFLLDRSGENYNPGIGLETRNNFFLTSATLRYGWLPGNESPLNSHYIFAESNIYNSSVDGSLESVSSSIGWSLVTKKTTEGLIYFTWEVEDLKDTYFIVDPDIFIPAGRYNFFSVYGNLYTTSPDRFISLTLTPEAGTYYDGYKFSASLQPGLNIGSSVMINGNYRIDRVVFNERSQRYTNNIFGLRSTFMFTTKLTFTTYIQYNTFSHRIITNARFRYNPREGSDFYIVYNEGIDASVRANFLTDHENENRTILLKYTYTFAF